MKKNTFAKILTFALTACVVPVAAWAGDILEIRPLEGSCEAASALKAGQKFKFVVRMVARDHASPNPKAWTPVVVPAGSTNLAMLLPPKMGIVVSGRMHYADMLSCAPHATKGSLFTDITFEYKVEPGDFALPVKLALKGSTEDAPLVPFIDDDGSANAGYYLKNVCNIDPSASQLWVFKDADDNVAEFSYCTEEKQSQVQTSWPEGTPIRDIDLSKAKFYAKSIDFDDQDETEAYWRVVPEGDVVSGSILTIGVSDTNAAPTYSTRLYVWSEDDDSVSLKAMEAKGATKKTLHFPNAGGTPVTAERWVYPIDLITGVKEYKFNLYGAAKETNTKLVLSASDDYVYLNDGSTLVTNFVTRAVACSKSTPSVKLSWDAAGTSSGVYSEVVQAFTNDLSEISEQGIPLYVRVSKAFGESVTLHLKAKIADDAADDYAFVWTNTLIGAKADTTDSFSVPPTETNVVFEGTELTHKFYLYPVGGLPKTKNPGVLFSLAFASGTSATILNDYELKTTCTLKFSDAKPAVVQPAAEDVYTFSGGSCTIPVIVSDTYRDLSAPRTFKVDVFANGTTLCSSNNVSFRYGEATGIVLDSAVLATIQGSEAKEMRLSVKVTDPLNNTATSGTATLQVPAKEKTPMAYAEIFRTEDTTGDADGSRKFAEGETRYLRISLGPDESAAASSSVLYGFIVPMDEASSNLVSITDKAGLETGLRIPSNGLASEQVAELNFKDGCAESGNLQFDFVIRTGDKLTDKIVSTYQSQRLYLSVTNVMTSVVGVNVNGAPDTVNPGETFKDALAANKAQTFVASVTEPSTVDVSSNIVAIWCFTDGRNSSTYKYEVVTSATESVSCSHAFVSPGVVQTVQVMALDKDMLKSYGDGKPLTLDSAKQLWSAMLKRLTPYKFFVNVADALHITVTPEDLSFTEGDKTGKLVIQLSQAPEADMTFKVTAETLNESGDAGYLTFNNDQYTIGDEGKKIAYIELTIKAGETEPRSTTDYKNGLKFKYDKIDGTGGSTDDGWYVKVQEMDGTVVAANPSYAAGEAYVYVLNKAPVISGGSSSTNTQMALNQSFDLTWRATDVKPDLDTGLNYKFTINDAEIGGNDEKSRPYSGKLTDSNVHTNSFKLTQEGLNVISLIVTDKESESYDNQAQVFWYYYISPTKRLELRAFGPSETTKSKYGKAAGLGQGRVWANGIGCTAENFLQNWTYGIKQAEAEVHAYGYAASNTVYYDDGNLRDAAGIAQRDQAINALGLSTKDGPYFSYDGVYDNYFYRWVYLDVTEGSASDTVTYGNPQPTKVANYDTKETVTLVAYDEKKESYETTRLEAIFSREYLAEDNLGDINADGIPDILTDKVGVMDANGAVEGDDLAKADAYNDDNDYLPNTDSSVYASFIPDLAETWVTEGRPYTAKLEIRGYGEGLNNALSLAGTGIQIKNHRSESNILTTFTEAESNAWVKAGSPKKADGTPDLAVWSPERPSDPTLEDTDGDGFPDGYEYYFWYLAHVGYVENGEHKYLTGKKYNPTDPANPILIQHEEIEGILDPITSVTSAGEDSASRDTDNDGLSDLAEFSLGTNPILYDTDGDGLPDGYEALFGGDGTLDPLEYATDGGICDGLRNPDADAMAYEYVTDRFDVFGFLNPADNTVVYRALDTRALYAGTYTNYLEMAKGEEGQSSDYGRDGYMPVSAYVYDGDVRTDGWLVRAVSGTTGTNLYYTTVDLTGKTRTDIEGKIRLTVDLVQDKTCALVEVKEENYLGRPAFVAMGTVLWEEPTPGAEAKTRRLKVIKVGTTTEMTEGVFGITDGDAPHRLYAAFQYGESRFATNAKAPEYGFFAIGGDASVDLSWPIVYRHSSECAYAGAPVYLLHHASYQLGAFDPRTAWKAGNAKTRAFTTYDEYLALPFHYYINARKTTRGMLDADLVPTKSEPWTTIWKKYLTNPFSADTDEDAMPDGWELYVMSGPQTPDADYGNKVCLTTPHATDANGPLSGNGEGSGTDQGVVFLGEFLAVDTIAAYPDVATIAAAGETWAEKGWRNKHYATDPWNDDTDGDGLSDDEEGSLFIYGDTAGGAAGGGLDPCSWDTDRDGLPDPFEAEFAGSFTAGSTTESATTTSVAEDGTTNTTTTVVREGGHWNNDGMDGTVNDANADYDSDGLLNWQEYMVGSMRCWRYDDTYTTWARQSFGGSLELNGIMEDSADWNRYWFDRLVCAPDKDGGKNGTIVENPRMHGHTDGSAREYEWNQRLVSDYFDPGQTYFSLCTNEWDVACGGWYMFKDGVYHDLAKPGPEWATYIDGVLVQFNRFTWWVYFTAGLLTGDPFDYAESPIPAPQYLAPVKYICTSPVKADTDNDGMDDYYELFHGLNPLLGESKSYDNGHKPPVDVIFESYGGGLSVRADTGATLEIWSAENNFWLNGKSPVTTSGTGATLTREPVDTSSKTGNAYDFVAYPWLAGLAYADPDGDNIRNQEEAIMPKLQAYSSWHHTDPTPLWMTDSSYTKSLTKRYYRPVSALGWQNVMPPDGMPYFEFDVNNDGTIDPAAERWDIRTYPGYSWSLATGVQIVPYVLCEAWGPSQTMYSFEENEGYDSDHDYLSDFEEAQGKAKSASDPQLSDDPLRRQAMWFDGVNSFLQTPLAANERSPVDSLPIAAELPFLYFTVECWAKPQDAANLTKPQTLVERAIWTGASNAGDMEYLRKNFQIGIQEGKWYAKYDSSGTDAKQAVQICDGPKATTNWTHVAATYDGKYLRLYVDGVCKKEYPSSIHPATGSKSVTQSDAGELRDGLTTYDYSSLLVGASALDLHGVLFEYGRLINSLDPTTFANYGSFFKGYIDEVRVWDGARSSDEILADCQNRKRYTSADCEANRKEVLAAWLQNADFTDDSTVKRPAEIRYHFSFDHIPGATKTSWVEQVPAGFSTEPTVADAKAKHWSRPDDWVCNWWNNVLVKSYVYTDRAWVPWIGNTAAHLPRPDGTTLDSFYWSTDYAGTVSAVSNGYTSYSFPMSAESLSKWTQMTYLPQNQPPNTTPTRHDFIEGLGDESAYKLYAFTLRHRPREGFDLLPMGGAYPKRISLAEGGMWDENGPADAWAETGVDSDHNSLPDWWEKYALAHYGKDLAVGTVIGWNTTVNYNGRLIAAYQAYLRDLARGLLPDMKYHDEYSDATALDANGMPVWRDVDGDGLPDWWEGMYGVDTQSTADALADPDHDGLSTRQEYLISEVYGLYDLNPTVAKSYVDQKETDYFLQVTNDAVESAYAGYRRHENVKGQYLGEIFADHDFLEDLDEGAIGTDKTHYDAYSDYDEDGWTAFAEQRYSQFKMGISARFVSHMVGDEEVTDSPVPVVHATLRYNGEVTSNATICVEAYSGNNLQKDPTATYTLTPGNAQTRYLNLGSYAERTYHGTLAPGHIRTGEDQLKLQFFFVQNDAQFSWTVSNETVSATFTGSYDEMIAAMTTYGESFVLSSQAIGWNDLAIGTTISYSDAADQVSQIAANESTQKGKILLSGKEAGTIDLVTGDFDLDLSTIGSTYVEGTAIRLSQCFFRIEYQSILPTKQTKALTVSLAKPDTGALTEGATAFVAYMDKDGNGAYTPAVDPIGFAKDVQIGWDNVPELVIEMTDNSQAACKPFAYADTDEMVRIVRTSINGKTENVKRRIVYSRNHALSTTTSRRTVYDADILTSATFGLDWANLASDIAAMDNLTESDVTSVGYTVVRGTQSVQSIPEDSVITNFTVSYTALPIKPVAYSPSASAMPIVETQRPTFKWTLPEGYTAFQLRINDAAGKLVYESAQQKMPPRDGSQRYVWTPPVYIGDIRLTNDTWQIANNSNYTWSVAVFNPKFQKAEWSEKAAFRTQLAEANDLSTEYGSAKVSVQYFGPATNSLGDVLVELYRTADCTGTPAARTRLADTDGLATSLTNAQEVAFHGLDSGDYYAVAFIDRNGDCARQRYESWGYAAQVGLGYAEIWTPVAVTVNANATKIPSVSLYLEDTDVNQNDIVDVFDDEKILKSADTSEAETLASTDTDGDGMPDKWEESNGLNPYDPSDAENALDGDVMAYVDLDVCLVQVETAEGREWYALTDYLNEPARIKDGLFQPQMSASNLVKVATTWKNGNAYGLGTNVTFGAADVILDSKLGTVRLVHAQVYAYRGFSAKTAVNAEDAVDTKSFTALDKYLVGSYFAALGVAEFQDMHLDPNKIDSDGDGLADGWELYVMYGKSWSGMLGGATAEESRTISPFVSEDALKVAPGAGSMLKLYEEYDAGYLPTNPWVLDTDGDMVIDYYAFHYHLKGDDAAEDADGDGLSNYAEYLSSYVFAKFPKCDPDRYATNDGVCDYYQRVGDLYLGEIFMDHDQVDDAWERAYATAANMYLYDPLEDPDGDGWSNYAESKAGTDPSLVESPSLGDNLAEYPIPIIAAKVSYNGAKSLAGGQLCFKAWSEATDAYMTSVPDAVWATGSAVSNTVKYVGKNPGKSTTYNIGPGIVTPGSVQIGLRDTQCVKVVAGQEDSTVLSSDSTKWYVVITDRYVDGSRGVLYTTVTNVADTVEQKSEAVGTIDYTTGLVTIDYQNLPAAFYTVYGGSATNDAASTSDGYTHDTLIKLTTANCFVCLSWTPKAIVPAGNMTYYLGNSEAASTSCRGHVREGLNSFLVWADLADGTEGAYDPGEPFGFAQHVDVGWQGASFSVALSDVSPIAPRFSPWASETSDRGVTVNESIRAMLTDQTKADDAMLAEAEDATTEIAETIHDQVQYADVEKTQARLRIVRFGINETFAYLTGVGTVGTFNGSAGAALDGLPCDPLVIDRTYDRNGRDFLCEADFLQDGELDLDWSRLRSEVCMNNNVVLAVGGVTNMTYLCVLENENSAGNQYWIQGSFDSNTVIQASSTVIERRFELVKHAPVANNVSVISYAARPTFRWSLPNEEAYAKKYGSSYTAFKLKVFAADGTQVYDSGVRRAPAQDANGVFVWTADVSAGDLRKAGRLFAATGDYTWQVAMYNAKFLPCENNALWIADAPSAKAAFSLAVNAQQPVNDHQYSSIDVAVKYAGPSNVIAQCADLGTLKGKVRVQAFASADFAGDPLSETIVVKQVDSFTNLMANATLVGLDAEGTYYLRAYIDSDGDHARDAWESYGASTPVTLSTSLAKAPLVPIWIEDSDLDQDWLPDAWEYVKFGDIAKTNATVAAGAKILFSTEAMTSATNNHAAFSTGLAGASLTIFENGAFAKALLGWGDGVAVTFDDIRAAVLKSLDVQAETFKITSLTLGSDGKVTLTVDAEVAPSIAGQLLSSVYSVAAGGSKTVTLKVYRKTSLAQAGWGDAVKTATVTIGAGAAEVQVDVGVTSEDLKSGFYKIDIVD